MWLWTLSFFIPAFFKACNYFYQVFEENLGKFRRKKKRLYIASKFVVVVFGCFAIILPKPQLMGFPSPPHTNTNTLLNTCMCRLKGGRHLLYTSAKHYGCVAGTALFMLHISHPSSHFQKSKLITQLLCKWLEKYIFKIPVLWSIFIFYIIQYI